MEIPNSKQQQLTFEKGITNVPSDILCSDNALSESVGMVYDNGEHRVIQEPKLHMSGLENSKSILYVHKLNNLERFIVREGDNIKWGTNVDGQYVPAQSQGSDIVLMTASGEAQITSIGNTLIITDSNGMHHYKWNGSAYEYIAYPIPDIHFEAKLVNTSLGIFASNSGDTEGIIEIDTQTTDPEDLTFRIVGGSQEEYNDLIVGLYSKNLKAIAKEKGFAEPFFVRAALEMYDGSYTYITNPILLLPSLTDNTKFYVYGVMGIATSMAIIEPRKLVAVTQEMRLFIRQTTDFSNYSDIIKDVVVFASKGINIYNTVTDQHLKNRYQSYTVGDNISSLETATSGVLTKSIFGRTTYTPPSTAMDGLYASYTSIRALEKREEKSIVDDIVGTSVFYKIASLGLKAINGFVDIGEKTTSEVTENLTSQDYLEYDDYYSRSSLIPNYTYAYNSRLNIANVNRGFFEGFGYFMPLDQDGGSTYYFDVTVKTDIGDKVVRHIEYRPTGPTQMQGLYFYYPDSRAKHVVIYKAGSPNKKILDTDLKEHPGLNGAYYFSGLPDENTTEPAGTTSDIPTYTAPDPENLYNQLIQSEESNPWVFLATGYHTVGTGDIIALSTITQALSEGQHGVYPLLVFSKNGIWGMSVDGTGLYSKMDPMSREICNNKKSIVQTDGAVFFTSEKGLMVVVGSQVKCVSEQLSGKQDAWANSMYGVTEPTFPNCAMGNVTSFFRNCHIAYDYRDSLLWIFSNSYAANYCYIYSIKSGVFSKYKLPAPSLNCVNNYPDYLIQVYSTGKVYSLLERPDINYDTKAETVGSVEVSNPIRYPATMLTRPMKLENALALKSIMHLENIKLFSAYDVITDTTTNPYTKVSQKATVKLRVFVSNNLDSWAEIHSLTGTPWKYYRFRYDFENLIATDRFAGTVLVTQERRTDKIR